MNDEMWKDIENKIKDNKEPFNLLFNIIVFQEEINDYDLSIILRYFIKHNIDLVLEFPLTIITRKLGDKFTMTKKIINEFYFYLSKKMELINKIVKFRKTYRTSETILKYEESEHFNSTSFKDKDMFSQRKELEVVNEIFRSYFESSTGEQNFSRFILTLKSWSNEFVFNELKVRLRNIYLLFGHDFFIGNEIHIITAQQFDEYSVDEKINIILYYYTKIEKTMKSILNSYDFIMLYDMKLKHIIEPRPIHINLKTIINTDMMDSESDYLELLIS